MDRDSTLPIYEAPPVVETVFSAQFENVSAQSVRIAQYWQSLRNRFPKIGIAQPLSAVFEPRHLTPNSQPLTVSFEHDNRVVFESATGDYVVQVQNNRFLFNWRKTNVDAKYPTFKVNFDYFLAELKRFGDFCEAEGLGTISFNQFELTYVNLIERNCGPNGVDFEDIFVDHEMKSSVTRFLPASESLNWSTSYKMEAELGRLHVATHTVFMPNRVDSGLVLRVELTARGRPDESGTEALKKWFEVAHRWVVCGFADLINPNVQSQQWRRLK